MCHTRTFFQFQQEFSVCLFFFRQNSPVLRYHLHLPERIYCSLHNTIHSAQLKVNHVVYDGGCKSNGKKVRCQMRIRIDLKAANTHTHTIDFCSCERNTVACSLFRFFHRRKKRVFLLLFQFCIEMQMQMLQH